MTWNVRAALENAQQCVQQRAGTLRYLQTFLASGFSCSHTFVYPRPLSATNAYRWAVPFVSEKGT